MKYVKQADTWHVVDPDGKPDFAEHRPHLRALCGQKTHTGIYPEPIDDGEHCKECDAKVQK